MAGEHGWRLSIQYGPDGEANYAWVYDPAGELVCTAKLHHAAAIVEACNAYAVIAIRAALAALNEGEE